MCGRFALATEKNILDMLYDLEIRTGFNLKPRYNIAPSQQVPVLRLSPGEGKRELVELKWGLVPFWAEDPSIGSRMINARAETAAEKPSFRDAFRKRRILVPASGFYEWKKEEGVKQPYFITRKDKKTFSMAGLWERWDKGDAPLESFTILTIEPNSLISELHNRMPVIIPEEAYKEWLNPAADLQLLQKLLVPYPPDELIYHPVSRLVNRPANDTPDLIKPL
ncbi:MAG: SOS response-associated peptidase [Firmicutes bacterium]|nr:SOS response-associated peptidase [Bacillota bacterium]